MIFQVSASTAIMVIPLMFIPNVKRCIDESPVQVNGTFCRADGILICMQKARPDIEVKVNCTFTEACSRSFTLAYEVQDKSNFSTCLDSNSNQKIICPEGTKPRLILPPEECIQPFTDNTLPDYITCSREARTIPDCKSSGSNAALVFGLI